MGSKRYLAKRFHQRQKQLFFQFLSKKMVFLKLNLELVIDR